MSDKKPTKPASKAAKPKKQRTRKPKIVVRIPDLAFKNEVDEYVRSKFGKVRGARSAWIIDLIKEGMKVPVEQPTKE